MSSAESELTQHEDMQVVVLLVNARSNNALERVLGLLRRRAPGYAAMNVTTSEASDIACVTVMLRGPRDAAEHIADHLRKLVDVRDCAVMNGAGGAAVVM
ncbi:MAG TPA: ACT domain-containing protein [Ktedonobacterales bacterium]|nr:ACT domain-containing protein [Ktedonobacterales bacterium]